MADNGPATPSDIFFRANKRRKVVRKRNIDDLDESAPTQPQEITDEHSGEYSRDGVFTVRRPAARKHGIGFSSTATQPAPDSAAVVETALVPFQKDEDQISAHDRFTKPTGKAEVIEDKHLTAYVDSKLAELRSTTSTVPSTQSETGKSPVIAVQSSSSTAPLVSQAILDEQPRNHKSRPNTRRATNRPPRRQREKDAGELAREAMVEQILGESQVPLYDQNLTSKQLSVDDGVDNDEAAAEAFKAEFLASMEEQNRRPPRAAPVLAKGEKPPPSGPKLGGSRAQRERMRAYEEAKNAAGGAAAKR